MKTNRQQAGQPYKFNPAAPLLFVFLY